MNLLLQLLAQFLRCVAMLCRRDGLKAVVAQNLLLKQQLIVLNRGRQRGPSVSPVHRIWLAFFSMFLSASRLQQIFNSPHLFAILRLDEPSRSTLSESHSYRRNKGKFTRFTEYRNGLAVLFTHYN